MSQIPYEWLVHARIYRCSTKHRHCCCGMSFHNNWPHGTGHNPHTPITQNTAWVAYRALTTPWGWLPYAETCRGKIWNALIKKSTTFLSICWYFYKRYYNMLGSTIKIKYGVAIDGSPQGSVNGAVGHSCNRAFCYKLPVLYKVFHLLF
jgi:hypothetical protein